MPQALNELGGSTGFRHQHALFGQPSLFVGRSLVQPLYYVNSTLCPRSLINNNNDKTESFYPSSPFPQENENQRQHSSSPFVLLIHRSSSCTFVQQVRPNSLVQKETICMGNSGLIFSSIWGTLDSANGLLFSCPFVRCAMLSTWAPLVC